MKVLHLLGEVVVGHIYLDLCNVEEVSLLTTHSLSSIFSSKLHVNMYSSNTKYTMGQNNDQQYSTLKYKQLKLQKNPF